MEIEKKHLIPYLDHNLKIWSNDHLEFTDFSDNIYDRHVYDLNTCNIGGVISRKEKPLLYPMSMVTKPITVNGKTFIPVKVLFDCSVEEEHDFDVYGTIPEFWKTSLELNITVHWTYYQVNLLIKWHFNVFDLHPELFIDKSKCDGA